MENQLKEKIEKMKFVSEMQNEIKEFTKKVSESIVLDYAFYKGMEARNNFRYKASFELSLYCSIIQSDLILAAGSLKNSTNEIEKKIYARILSLTLYEYLKDLSSILGKELVNELKNIHFEDLIESVYNLNKEFTDYKKTKDGILKKIRHETIAHKTKNRISLIEQLFSINEMEIYNFATEIIILNNKLINILKKVKVKISDFHAKSGQLKHKGHE